MMELMYFLNIEGNLDSTISNYEWHCVFSATFFHVLE